ncbi:hypothetical protein EXH44_01175 [Actinobacillus indolicus]|uniref:L,D-TPase catalytic domain-containing protein n=1 Tax=Actinobacillus indolicus TaxID=51049 RepID=A0A4P7CG82_9PAST|nr:L,D-transpeptidase family protein [Actinobacillus indolicus]QBQ62934.1 hypothetical protein EXH44_01175 [Actinobacillus indolicus]
MFRSPIILKILAIFLIGLVSIWGYFYYQTHIRIDQIILKEQPTQPLLMNEKMLTSTNIDRLVVFKSKRQMWAYEGETLVKIYPISLGFSPIGHKQFEGDGKTPEGVYKINERNPNSAYHKNLGISYPNEEDKAYAALHNKSAGGLIKIHGLRNGSGSIGRLHLLKDWTHGCIAVTNEEMDELYEHVVHNAIIDIRP